MARHLPGRPLPAVALPSTSGRPVLTLLVRGGRIEDCFYPVFPPDADAGRVLAWLRDRKDRERA